MVSVIPGGESAIGPLGVSWVEVMEHMKQRVSFVDEKLVVDVVTDDELRRHGPGRLGADTADIVYLMNLHDEDLAQSLVPALAGVPNVISLNSSSTLQAQTHIKSARPYGRFSGLWRRLPVSTERKRLLTLFDTVLTFWERGHSDDLLFMMLVVINAAVTQIKSVSEVCGATAGASAMTTGP